MNRLGSIHNFRVDCNEAKDTAPIKMVETVYEPELDGRVRDQDGSIIVRFCGQDTILVFLAKLMQVVI